MRPVRLHDTRTREIRRLVPITPPKIGLFVCGLTPYDEAHLGHGKLAVTFDVVARAFRRFGYRVFYVQNVTNLDDKVLRRAGEMGIDPLVLSERYFRSWLHAMESLGIRSVNYYPFATDYIAEILAQIGQLIAKGYAYPAGGSVYYSVAKFAPYGELSGQRVEALKPGARVAVEPEKQAPEDFVLWKAAAPGEPSWESPWGPGRPGWHIEDTAITVRLLGARYDVHGGATDLKFPHHEAEIAQAEAATGEAPLVNVWMHMGLLTMAGEKMSKSIGNVSGLHEAIETYGADVLRFYYLNANYRSPLEFDPEKSLAEAREAYDRLVGPARRLDERSTRSPPGSEALSTEDRRAVEGVVDHLDELLADDVRTREAIAALFDYGRFVQERLGTVETLDAESRDLLQAPYHWATEVLGLCGEPAASAVPPGVVEAALAARSRARGRGDFPESDRIRADLKAAGIEIEDEGGVSRWRPADPDAP